MKILAGKKKLNVIPHYEAALRWIKANTLPEKGIVVSSARQVPYLEVTGYLIPTLFEAGESALAFQYADFLTWMQRPSGAFAGPDGKEYIFDTGQILKGLLEAARRRPVYEVSARRAADFIVSAMTAEGQLPSPYNGEIPESVHVYVLSALMRAAEVLREDKYREAALKSLSYYTAREDVLSPKMLSHFSGYVADGFLDMGATEKVRPFVDGVFASQRLNGAIPAFEGAGWICSAGVAQWALIGYRVGRNAEADRAIQFLCRTQNPTGGFFGSYGRGGRYFPSEEIPWSAKFFLDAMHAKVRVFFDSYAPQVASDLSFDDGRLQAVRDGLSLESGRQVLDAGCGKGRFSRALKEFSPGCVFHGVDISGEILKTAPDFLIKQQASLLDLPYGDGVFDSVFAVESLQHAVRMPRAVAEICRVTRDEGRIVIVDKNIRCSGRRQMVDFEQWFDGESVKKELCRYCRDVAVKTVSYEGLPDRGLFLCWTATREARLHEDEWHLAMTEGLTPQMLAARLTANDLPVWAEPLLRYTNPGDTVLEIGSGTGELCAALALYGRDVHLMDFSSENLNFSKELFSALGLKAGFHEADMLSPWPFAPGTTDWVFSSGVLEHFSDEVMVEVLAKSLSASRRGIISLVPNAASLAYRAGKMRLERAGRWRYGFEAPKYSMRPYFEKAGCVKVVEFSVAPYQALKFAGGAVSVLKEFFDEIPRAERDQLNQGYLLFTLGEKA